ncbi:MAG: M14 family zinc carboxypeptidase [Pseudomonadales bacterium]
MPVALFLICLTLVGSAAAAEPARPPFDSPGTIRLEDYFPASSEEGFDDSIPRPETVVGHEIGNGFARHDRVVAWFEALAAASPRVRLVDIGRTHEGRRQITAIISSAGNLDHLDEIQRAHMDGDASAPLITWHGYSIHGNEPSGTQAAMAVAWYLTASRDPKVLSMLRRVVIMIDPALNPDGYGRFESWANQARGQVPVGDALHRERQEAWPGGRTNHYFFDLNRDWLLLQQPETVNRVDFLRRYTPHVMTDHHEMKSASTFFFQPGVASRWHPMIPKENRAITEALGKFHARALDRAHRLYYSGESFDDFYPGKGSTWPDLQGTVGVLFEQASTQGLVRDTRQGRITLPMAIHNHVLATLSTLKGSLALESEIRSYRTAYYNNKLLPSRVPAGWIFDDGGDPARAAAMVDLIKGQGISVFGLTAGVKIEGRDYRPGRAWVVPVLGPKGALAQTLFATEQEFEDSTFYDVSAWSLPHAFGVTAAPLARVPAKLDTHNNVNRDYGVSGRRDAVAWVLPWDDFYAPAVLARLQDAGVSARVALRDFSASSNDAQRKFKRGAVVVHSVDLPELDERPRDFLRRIAAGDAPLVGLDNSSTSNGPDLGSPQLVPLEQARIAMFAGFGVNQTAMGAMWHLFDERLGMPVTLVRPDSVDAAFLARHTHLIVADGKYEKVPESVSMEVERWVDRGGVLILTRRAVTWAQTLGWLPKPPEETPETQRHPYEEMAARDGAQQIGGSILAVELDQTHPLAFGINIGTVGLLRQGRTTLIEPKNNPFTVVGAYAEQPLIGGYLPTGYADSIAGSPAILAVPKGAGVIVAFADDPAFRAIWWVGQRLLSNAISFATVIKPPNGKYGPTETPP